MKQCVWWGDSGTEGAPILYENRLEKKAEKHIKVKK